MDPVDPTQLQATINQQGHALAAYKQQLVALQASNKQLLQVLANAPATRYDYVHMAPPEKLDGAADNYRGFHHQCEIYFTNQPNS